MMFERFSTDARATVVSAQQEARTLADHHIGTEHLLLALLDQPDSLANRVLVRSGVTRDGVVAGIQRIRQSDRDVTAEDREALKTIGIDLDAVRTAVEDAFGPGALSRHHTAADRERRVGWRRRKAPVPGQPPRGHIPFSPRAKKVLEQSLREALRLKHGYIGTEHLLLGLVADGQGLATQILVESGTDLARLREAILSELAQTT
jgi:ATP-dependent Clp protease ATP-binding subunit ClpA